MRTSYDILVKDRLPELYDVFHFEERHNFKDRVNEIINMPKEKLEKEIGKLKIRKLFKNKPKIKCNDKIEIHTKEYNPFNSIFGNLKHPNFKFVSNEKIEEIIQYCEEVLKQRNTHNMPSLWDQNKN